MEVDPGMGAQGVVLGLVVRWANMQYWLDITQVDQNYCIVSNQCLSKGWEWGGGWGW